MPRRISSGKVGRQLLGQVVVEDNQLQSVLNNSNIELVPNGSGIVTSSAHVQVADDQEIRMSDGATYVSFKAPAAISNGGQPVVLTLPANDGDADQFLKTDGSGALSFAASTVSITNQTADPSNTYYPLLSTSTSGNISTVNTSNTKLSFNTNSGQLSATTFSGALSGNLTSNSVDINGGAIDGTTIGAATPATGTFTTLNATTINETSSITYKENITPINNALESILQLVGVTYDRKDGSNKNEAGLIAEEIAEVLPNLVKYKDGKPEAITYTKLTAYLIEAVKSLHKEIVELKRGK